MKATVLRGNEMVVVDDLPAPTPRPGQVRARVLACGICGSDLHFARHAHDFVRLAAEMVEPPSLTSRGIDLGRDIFMGHEFCAEVLEVGPDTDAPAPGTVVTSVPALETETGHITLAYTNDAPCGYSEEMLLSADLLLRVPNGLHPNLAALTEPTAVGFHAVTRSGIRAGDGAVVIGCGPVGLAIVAVLAARGIEPIVTADFSPARRDLAARMGAHVIVDAGVESGIEVWRRASNGRSMVVFEAVGSPGVLNAIMREAPRRTRIVVAGVCMEVDNLVPYFGAGKELELVFTFGYDHDEFAQALRSIADGSVDVAPMITGTVPLDQVPDAFRRLATPNEDAKILVTPAGAAS